MEINWPNPSIKTQNVADKPNNRICEQSKKHGGKQNDVTEWRAQLDALGFKIIQVTADGNCFLRALADQLEGDEDEHEKYQSMVVQFIKDLQQVSGDVDAAVEILVAEQGTLDQIVVGDEISHSLKTLYGAPQDENYEQRMLKVDETYELDLSGKDAKINDNKNNPRPGEKKISRNKACPCGSKKKYKSCCAAVAGKSSARFPVNQTVDYGKSRKDRKQGKKVGPTGTSSGQSDGGPPDMGALCI